MNARSQSQLFYHVSLRKSLAYYIMLLFKNKLSIPFLIRLTKSHVTKMYQNYKPSREHLPEKGPGGRPGPSCWLPNKNLPIMTLKSSD